MFVGVEARVLKKSQRKWHYSEGYMDLWGLRRMVYGSSITAAAFYSACQWELKALLTEMYSVP